MSSFLQLWLVLHLSPGVRIRWAHYGPGLPPQALRQPLELVRQDLGGPHVFDGAHKRLASLLELPSADHVQIDQGEWSQLGSESQRSFFWLVTGQGLF
jgi:hypothetical protein